MTDNPHQGLPTSPDAAWPLVVSLLVIAAIVVAAVVYLVVTW